MSLTTLGSTGLKISRLVLGTMTFGLQTDEPTSHAILDVAAEAGINFLDTADVYPVGGGLPTVGRTEEILIVVAEPIIRSRKSMRSPERASIQRRMSGQRAASRLA
jgi:aryl-alcohol dehydrogenase-like predicted oxidoreductase